VADVVLENLSRRFRRGVIAVNDMNLRAAHGELTVLVGPSGCGKTTTLRLIAGLEQPDHGMIQIGGRVVNRLSPFEREVAMVFQDAALYPHLTVRKNFVFPLKQRGIDRPEIDRRVTHIAQLLQIEHLLDRKPGELSGGEQQRAALGRTLIQRPAVALLDEPLNQLDASLRRTMRREIRALQHRLAQTMIFVTHDQHEAMALGDRLAVMCEGRVLQIDAPTNVYKNPADQFVSQFIGDPPMNLLEGYVKRIDGTLCFELPQMVNIALPQRFESALSNEPEQNIVLGIRPAHLQPCSPDAAELTLRNTRGETVGDSATIHGELPDGQTIAVQIQGDGQTSNTFTFNTDHLHLFEPGRFGRNLTANATGSDNPTTPV